MTADIEWISISEYAKRHNLKSPQVVYNWIATGKMKEGKDWKTIEVKHTHKLVNAKTKREYIPKK